MFLCFSLIYVFADNPNIIMISSSYCERAGVRGYQEVFLCSSNLCDVCFVDIPGTREIRNFGWMTPIRITSTRGLGLEDINKCAYICLWSEYDEGSYFLYRSVTANLGNLLTWRQLFRAMFRPKSIWIENGRNIARNNCLQVSKLPKLAVTDL